MTTQVTNWSYGEIAGAEAASLNFGFLVLNQPIYVEPKLIITLWSQATLRFLVDGGANRWLKFIRDNSVENLPLPDLITGDFDSITDSTRKYFEERNVRFVCTDDQDETDFTKSLRELQKLSKEKNLKLHHALALGTNSGRMDQIMANLETLHISRKFLQGMPVYLMSSNSVTWLLPTGAHVIRVPEEFVRAKFAVGMIPLSGPTVTTTSGLVWNLNNTRMAFGELVSTSNTYEGATVNVKCDKDLIWTMQFAVEGDQ